MTGEKRTETRRKCYKTLCIPYISLHPSLHALYVYDCREGRKSDQASAKLDLTFTNVDLTNVRCQTVTIGPACFMPGT